MKGFSLKRWIEAYQKKCPRLEGDSFERETDASVYDNIVYYHDDLSKLTKEEVKELKKQFIETQKSEANGHTIVGGVDMFSLENLDIDYFDPIPNEENIIRSIQMIAAGASLPKNASNAELLKKAEKVNKILNTFVYEGYNIYPMLTSLTNGKKEFEKPPRKPGNEIDAKMNGFGIRVLENAEKLSPYKEVFDLSDKIAELNIKRNKAIDGSDPDYDDSKAVEEIEALKDQLTKVVANYDPDFLRATADSRLDYLTATGSDKRIIHANGLAEIRTGINRAERMKEQQMEDNTNAGKPQFTGVMNETPNAKDGIRVEPVDPTL